MLSSVLIMSQVYMPDPAAVGQHLYDAPGISCPRHGFRNGVHVRRLPLSSFGTSSLAARLLAQGLVMIRTAVRGLLTRGLARVLISTSPDSGGPLISMVRCVPLVWRGIDLNPDQVVALGRIHPPALAARRNLIEQAGLPTDMGATNPLRSRWGL